MQPIYSRLAILLCLSFLCLSSGKLSFPDHKKITQQTNPSILEDDRAALGIPQQAPSIGENLAGCGLCVALEFGLSFLVMRILGSRGTVISNGSPMWSWYISLFHQLVVFPAIIGTAIVFRNSLFADWLLSPSWGWPEIAFHWVFIAYLAKDLPIPLTPMVQIHHVGCAFFAFLSVSGSLVRGQNAFATGCIILELGSGSQSLTHLFPNSKSINLAQLFGTSVSNVLAIVLLVWWAIVSQDSPMVWRVTHPLVGIGLSYGRQVLTWKEFVTNAARLALASKLVD